MLDWHAYDNVYEQNVLVYKKNLALCESSKDEDFIVWMLLYACVCRTIGG